MLKSKLLAQLMVHRSDGITSIENIKCLSNRIKSIANDIITSFAINYNPANLSANIHILKIHNLFTGVKNIFQNIGDLN